MESAYDWMRHAARSAKFAVNNNGRAWFRDTYVPSLPEHRRAFAIEKLAEYEARLAEANAMAGERCAETRPYRRAGLVPIPVVIANVGGSVRVGDQDVSCQSWRIRLYAAKGVKCAHCGMEGTTFAAERNKHQLSAKCHLNLYHVAQDGKETMITVDHIIPKSRGGGNELSNLQPLCIRCNGKKGNKMPDGEAA